MISINQIMCPFPLNILIINRPILTKIRDEITYSYPINDLTDIMISLIMNIVCIFDYIICTR